LIESIAAVLAGVALGIITGLLPGLHINSVLVLLLEYFDSQNFWFVLVVVSMSITNQFTSFIPSILLGVPSEQTFLSVLPGHAFVKKGLGLHAIRLSIAGGVAALVFSVLFTPVLGLLLSKTNDFFSSMVPFALSSILALMVLREKTTDKKIIAGAVVALSAASGLALLNNSMFSQNLFVLVTGFFAVPTILLSLKEDTAIPKQKTRFRKINVSRTAKSGFLATITAIMSALFPALGPNEMIFISSEFAGKQSRAKYLLLNGGMAASSFLFSFTTLFFIGKARTGAAAFVGQATEMSTESLAFIMAAAIASCGIAALATEFIGKKAARETFKTDYRKINKTVLGFLLVLTIATSGIFGIIALASASATGLLAATGGIRRTACMAFLIVPTILLYLNA